MEVSVVLMRRVVVCDNGFIYLRFMLISPYIILQSFKLFTL